MIVKSKSKSKMAAAIIFELFIMAVIFMAFEDAKADSVVKIKIQDGYSKQFKDIILDVVFMVFGYAQWRINV